MAMTVEELASKLCRSGKFETGQGTCALVCMDQLGDPRNSGCHHVMRVFEKIAKGIIAKGNV